MVGAVRQAPCGGWWDELPVVKIPPRSTTDKMLTDIWILVQETWVYDRLNVSKFCGVGDTI